VTMTVHGALWLDFVSKALRAVDDGVRTLKQSPFQLTGEIRIAAGQGFCAWLMPACLEAFLEKQPSVKVVIEQVVGSYLIERLSSGELDLGIGYRPPDKPGVVFEPIYDEELRLVVPEGHPFARRKKVSVIELHSQRMALLSDRFSTRQMLNDCFASVGAEPVVVVEANSYATLLSLVPTLNLLTVAPEYPPLALPGVSVLSIENPAPVRTFGLIWKRGAQKSLAIQTFAAVVRQAIEGTGAKRPARGKRHGK